MIPHLLDLVQKRRSYVCSKYWGLSCFYTPHSLCVRVRPSFEIARAVRLLCGPHRCVTRIAALCEVAHIPVCSPAPLQALVYLFKPARGLSRVMERAQNCLVCSLIECISSLRIACTLIAILENRLVHTLLPACNCLCLHLQMI